MRKLNRLMSLLISLSLVLSSAIFLGSAAVSGAFINPGDSLGGGGTATSTPTATEHQRVQMAQAEIGALTAGLTAVPEGATQITGKYEITAPGDYYVSTAIEGKKITVSCEGATLYLVNATLSNEKKVIDSSVPFTITLIGNSTVTNSNTAGSNAIDCLGKLTINGSGSLTVNSTKNGIVADSITVNGATLDITAAKDALHAEISAFDDETLTSAPTFSYSAGGYFVANNANITVNSTGDAIQADTFVYMTDTVCNITAGGGAPSSVNSTSSNNADGKGIKAGPLDWGPEDANGNRTDLASDDYLVYIKSGTYTINSNDDAVHSNSTVVIDGGSIVISTGDDGIHGDKLLQISGGDITINKSYEGVEAAKVEINGGVFKITSSDDGVNGADGTSSVPGNASSNCHIIITGGDMLVNAGGDGIDSNGSLLISGGELRVSGSTSGANAALDTDGSIIVNGGYLMAVGALGMVETPVSNSAQCCVSFAYSSSLSANTAVSVTDSSGNDIYSFTVPKGGQSIIISTPEFVIGGSYKIYIGGSEVASFTISSIITSVGSSGSAGGGGTTNPGGGGWGSGSAWHRHSMTYTSSKTATCQSEGNTAYYYCSGCGKYYSDANGRREITLASTVISKIAHTYGTDYSSNASGHWSYCTMCGAESNLSSHTPNINSATTSEAKYCTVCKYVIEEQLHFHSMSYTAAKAATCTSEGNTAYYYCSGCARYYSDAAGTNEITLASTVVAMKNHTYGTSYGSDSTGHWFTCTACSAKGAVTAHVPNVENATTETAKYCVLCSYVIEQQLPTIPTETVVGDANNDGVKSMADVKYLINFMLFGESLYPVNQNMDYNSDNSVNNSDAARLLSSILFGS